MADADLFLSSYVQVEHYTKDLTNQLKEGYVQDASLQAVSVNIQSASKEALLLYGGAYGESYTIFTTCSGILQTDRLTTVSGNYSAQYIVKGVQAYDYGLGQHVELYCQKVV